MLTVKVVACVFLANVWTNVSADECKINDVIFNGNHDMIDLSYEFDSKTIYWPGGKQFDFTKKTANSGPNDTWYAANDFEAAEHGGTHLDAPAHFHREGRYVGDIPLKNLIAPLIIVDISSRVNGDPNFVLYKHHMDYLLNDNNGKPCLIIFKFGWSRFYGEKSRFLGINQTDGTLNFPGLSKEVAEWIVEHKNVVGVGVDVASIDPGYSTDFPAHTVLCRAGLYLMEHVKLDQHVPEYGCTGIALPMKIAMGTGGPLRLVAICPKQTPTTF